MKYSISGIATETGINKAVIYRYLHRDGIDLETLRDADGSLTQGGMQVVLACIDRNRATKQEQKQDSTQQQATATTATYTEADMKLQAAEGKIRELESINELLRQQIEQLTRDKTFLQDQNTRLLLTPPRETDTKQDTEQQPKRRTFWKLLKK